MPDEKNDFLKLAGSPFKFGMFLFFKIPIAFLSGIRIKEITNDRCITTVPYKWLTQNPFHSTYFASLSMAAELSTGALAMMNTHKRQPPVSMLVTKMEANYFKKATGKIYFVCEEGATIENVVTEACERKESKSINVRTVGKNDKGELVAEFIFTWSFKEKQGNKT